VRHYQRGKAVKTTGKNAALQVAGVMGFFPSGRHLRKLPSCGAAEEEKACCTLSRRETPKGAE